MGFVLRVAVLSWESLYTVQVGGLAVVVTNLAEKLVKAGHEVCIFTRRASGQPQYMEINGVHYYTFIFNPISSSYTFALDMSKAMVSDFHKAQVQIGQFDVVHGHDWLVVDALNDLKNEGLPIVLTFHSTEYGRNGGNFGDWWAFETISDRESYGGQIADRVTTVSECMKSELNWLYKIPLEKIDVVPNGIDPARFKMKVDPGKLKERLGMSPLAPTVLFVGRLEYQKGPDILLEAMPRVLENRRDAKFIFVGEGGMRSYLENRSRELGVADATRFLGFISQLDLLEVLNSSDIVCLPSRNEPFGMVLLEAWAAGKPVVATDVGGLGENIDNLINGVKVDGNPESVAGGLNYVLNSTDVAKRVAEEGAKKVGKFSWDRAIDKLMYTYAKISR